MDESFRVSQCKSAKEMWEVLEVTHEGTNDVKRARKHALIQEYELFNMKQGEYIADVQKRFTHNSTPPSWLFNHFKTNTEGEVEKEATEEEKEAEVVVEGGNGKLA